MGTDQNALKRAVIGIGTVMGTLGNRAFNTFISVRIHIGILLSTG